MELPNTELRAGRPLSYCSTRCRRAVEKEIRRTNREIDRLTKLATHLRTAIATGDDTYFLGWGRPREALRGVESRLAVIGKRAGHELGAVEELKNGNEL